MLSDDQTLAADHDATLAAVAWEPGLVFFGNISLHFLIVETIRI